MPVMVQTDTFLLTPAIACRTVTIVIGPAGAHESHVAIVDATDGIGVAVVRSRFTRIFVGDFIIKEINSNFENSKAYKFLLFRRDNFLTKMFESRYFY